MVTLNQSLEHEELSMQELEKIAARNCRRLRNPSRRLSAYLVKSIEEDVKVLKDYGLLKRDLSVKVNTKENREKASEIFTDCFLTMDSMKEEKDIKGLTSKTKDNKMTKKEKQNVLSLVDLIEELANACGNCEEDCKEDCTLESSKQREVNNEVHDVELLNHYGKTLDHMIKIFQCSTESVNDFDGGEYDTQMFEHIVSILYTKNIIKDCAESFEESVTEILNFVLNLGPESREEESLQTMFSRSHEHFVRMLHQLVDMKFGDTIDNKKISKYINLLQATLDALLDLSHEFTIIQGVCNKLITISAGGDEKDIQGVRENTIEDETKFSTHINPETMFRAVVDLMTPLISEKGCGNMDSIITESIDTVCSVLDAMDGKITLEIIED